MIWGNLLHLATNMWEDVPPAGPLTRDTMRQYVDELMFDEDVWNQVTEHMAATGMNMVVIDLGDAVQYESHPEIAVRGAWSIERLTQELTRLRQLGLEPIPKLNFSASHDAWLGTYERQVSTPAYYQVCSDLIGEVAQIFGQPRFFHIGMDEETAAHQRRHHYTVVRQGDLWWHDLNFIVDEVDRTGSRPWVWSDPAWQHPDTYFDRMPKHVLQSNWHYREVFSGDESGRPRELTGADAWLTYLDLDEHGFEQVPTASSWQGAWDCFRLTVDFGRRRLDQDRVVGYLQTPWKPTTRECLELHLRTVDVVREARDSLGL